MRKAFTILALASLPVLYGCAAALVGGAAAGGYLVGEDRRPTAIMTEDQDIEFRTTNRIKDKYPTAHVNVTSYNHLVLLTGEAPSAEAKAEIEKIARDVPRVRGTFNELVVGPSSGFSARAND